MLKAEQGDLPTLVATDNSDTKARPRGAGVYFAVNDRLPETKVTNANVGAVIEEIELAVEKLEKG